MFKPALLRDNKSLKTINTIVIGFFVSFIVLSLSVNTTSTTTTGPTYVEKRYSMFNSSQHLEDYTQNLSYNPAEVFNLQSEK